MAGGSRYLVAAAAVVAAGVASCSAFVAPTRAGLAAVRPGSPTSGLLGVGVSPVASLPVTARAGAGRTAMASDSYKYVVVGGGTSGCVLANRLTENKDNSVLVLEAGSKNYDAKEIKVPVGLLRLFKSIFDWGFESSKEEFIAGEGIYLCRGKVLGGSSCTNAMLYHRGSEADYDDWKVEGWGSKDVLPYFTKAEGNRSKRKGKYHGKGGMMSVEDVNYKNSLTKRFMKACKAAGFSPNDDFNDWSKPQEGFGFFQLATKGGRRCSAAASYLKKALGRKNLNVQTEAQITKILTENGAATGVEYVQGGEKRVAKIVPGGEVILAGGAISSPQILMLSGIGPAKHLQAKGIPVVSDLEGVGQNLQDHPAITVMADIKKPIAITDHLFKKGSTDIRATAGLKWLLAGKGPLTSPGCDSGGFFKTSQGKDRPDLQVRFVPGRANTPDGVQAYNEIGSEGRPPSGITFQLVGIRAKSTGTVSLSSSDPFDKPQIVTNYLKENEDMETLSKGIDLAKSIMEQEPLKDAVAKQVFPSPGDSQVADYVKSTVHSANALVGTCKLGAATDPLAVVDPELRVKGVKNLRVVDSSVIPIMPGGQTGAPTVMIAEKAADMIAAAAA